MQHSQSGFRSLRVRAADGAEADLHLWASPEARRGLYFLPALGVGLRPNHIFASALAEAGIAVALHEWRGLGGSSLRAQRRCDWGYRELLELDLPAGLAAARAAAPGLCWEIGGHSLGGQLALLAAALQPEVFQRVHVIASGMPDWRAYSRLRGLGIWAALHALPGTARLLGHYPGERFGFAGREALGVLRDWSHSGRHRRYRLRDSAQDPEAALQAFRGRVQALHMRSDWLCPSRSLQSLAAKTPQADWRIETLDDAEFAPRRADHFAWLKAPAPVVQRVLERP
ncbi:MAG: alpha/beta hydrolase [Aquimonas sp.]|nr:alpha/beta hydrolase [Aquimonas sp.]